jgi:hypothetical protein
VSEDTVTSWMRASARLVAWKLPRMAAAIMAAAPC